MEEKCATCGGTGEVPDSLDNYAYDAFSMAPCPSCSPTPRTNFTDAPALDTIASEDANAALEHARAASRER